MTIRDIIIKYTEKLAEISDTPRLDTEVMLLSALGPMHLAVSSLIWPCK